jgi:hypothetical protein
MNFMLIKFVNIYDCMRLYMGCQIFFIAVGVQGFLAVGVQDFEPLQPKIQNSSL